MNLMHYGKKKNAEIKLNPDAPYKRKMYFIVWGECIVPVLKIKFRSFRHFAVATDSK